jgi:hypothetical protein
MLTRTLFVFAVVVALCGTVALGQQKSTAPSSSPLREFPVVLQQNVEAGKTPVGAKVQAKLAVGTTFHGVVIPRNAVVTGVVFESVRKSATAPSRLGIRMENAKWKDESTCMMKAYLMPLYYPMVSQSTQGPPTESPDPSSRTTNGPNQSSSSPMSQPSFAGGNSEAVQEAMPNILTLSSRPVPMKNVVMEPVPDNGLDLVSQHDNIKLYKMTTYVLAAIESPAK